MDCPFEPVLSCRAVDNAVCVFHWDDATRTLTIDDRKGEYKGMLKKRNFRILVVDRQSPSGDKEPPQFSRSVRYNGKAQAIKL